MNDAARQLLEELKTFWDKYFPGHPLFKETRFGYQSEYQRNSEKKIENVGIWITREQKQRIDTFRDKLAKEYEESRDKQHNDPEKRIIHKWSGYAFIRTHPRAHFVDGKCENIYFGNTNVGRFSLQRQHATDYEYVIDRQIHFKKCLYILTDFYLEVGYYHDGCVGGWFAKVFDSKINGNELANLEDLNLNAQ
jgi:hypothetical protein